MCGIILVQCNHNIIIKQFGLGNRLMYKNIEFKTMLTYSGLTDKN